MIKKKTEKPQPIKADVTMLEHLIEECYKKLLEKLAGDVKVGDFLKMVEMRMKLAPSESEQATFWKMLDKVRMEVMAKKEPGPTGSSKAKKPAVPAKKK